jgi:hypothetical protein
MNLAHNHAVLPPYGPLGHVSYCMYFRARTFTVLRTVMHVGVSDTTPECKLIRRQ